MLILGESQVGKTSLYRQLVGKEFREDLESTLGIDNNIVDTVVDERSITMEKSGNVWHETKEGLGQLCDASAVRLCLRVSRQPIEVRHVR